MKEESEKKKKEKGKRGGEEKFQELKEMGFALGSPS